MAPTRRMTPSSLVPGALEAAFEGGHETGVLVGDDQPHRREATAFQRGEEAKGAAIGVGGHGIGWPNGSPVY